MIAELVKSRSDELARLCSQFHVRRLELFGSAAREDFDEGRSDLDFLVEFESMDPRGHCDSYFGLLFALRDLFTRKVDLVEMDGVKNPYVRASIERSRTPIYVRA